MVARAAIQAGLLGSVAFAVAGCASLQDAIEVPQISLSNVQITEAQLTHQTFLLDFDVLNPNPIPIPIASIGYAVDLAGQRFASGENTNRFTLPANGSGTFQIRVNTDLMQSARALSRLVLEGGQREIDYGLSGAFRIDLPGISALPFRHEGAVTLAR